MNIISPIHVADHKRRKDSQNKSEDDQAQSFDAWHNASAANTNARKVTGQGVSYNDLIGNLKKPPLSVSNFITATHNSRDARINKLVSKVDHYKALQRSDRRQYGFDFLYSIHTDKTL